MQDQWFIIRNPISGNGKGEKDWPKIQTLLNQHGLTFKSARSDYFKHTIELAKQAYADGFRKIMAIGGDGTINEIVNGIASENEDHLSEITLAVLPIGKGNDWVRTMGLKGNYEEILQQIKAQNTIKQDIGRMETTMPDAENSISYFANLATAGFSGFVATKVNAMVQAGKKVGVTVYLIQLLKCLFKYKLPKTGLEINGKKIETNLFTLAAGIGKSNGGGMKQAPDAIPDDGLFDITVINNATKWMVISNIARLFSGTFVKHPQVDQYRSDSLKIEGENIIIEADGELFGHAPARFTLLPNKLTVIIGKNYSP